MCHLLVRLKGASDEDGKWRMVDVHDVSRAYVAELADLLDTQQQARLKRIVSDSFYIGPWLVARRLSNGNIKFINGTWEFSACKLEELAAWAKGDGVSK